MDASGIILAGGKSRRFGRDEAVESLGGKPLIARVVCRMTDVTRQLVVVVDDMKRVRSLALPESATVAADIYPGTGALGAIFTGLLACDSDWGVVVACDMPFLSTPLLRHMLTLRDGHDVVAPALNTGLEPTHAAYSKACLPHMERRLQANELKITGFFDEVRVAYIPEHEIDQRDPLHLSFFNLNTESDLDRARELVAQGH